MKLAKLRIFCQNSNATFKTYQQQQQKEYGNLTIKNYKIFKYKFLQAVFKKEI